MKTFFENHVDVFRSGAVSSQQSAVSSQQSAVSSQNSTIVKVLILTVVLTFTIKFSSMAQFTSAALSDNGNGVSVSANNTGNDILDVSGDIYRISVWSEAAGTTPGMAWTVDAAQHWANKQYFNQTSNILHTDVCLVKDGSDIWAIVAWYYSGSGASWNIEAYKWTVSGTNGTFSYQANAYVNGSYGTTLNIDGDDNGNFVAVYDDNNQDIYALTGTVTGGFAMNNSGNAVPITPNSANNGTFPDACIYYNSTPTEDVYISYIDDNGNLNIDKHSFYNLSNGTGNSSSSELNISPPNYYFSDCRIACPNSSGSSGEWTVVVLEADHSSAWNIIGYNYNTASTPIYYNTGTYVTTNGNIRAIPNYNPVVAYTSNYGNDQSIWVGWMVNDLGNANAYVPNAEFPVVMPCDPYAVPVVTTYWIVPYTLNTNNAISCLSLAGRYADDLIFCTYWNVNNNGNIYTKETAASTATSLKYGDNTDLNNLNELISIQYFTDDNIIMEIFDSMGKRLKSEKGNGNQLLQYIYDDNNLFAASIYLFRLRSNDGKICRTFKFGRFH